MNWQDIVKAALSRYHLEAQGNDLGIQAALAEQSAFNLHSGLSTTKVPRGATRFRAQDVEPLLDQALIILDKAAADRNTWQATGEKFANLKLDLSSSLSLDTISLAEEADGRFKVEEQVSLSQRKANDAKIKAATAQKVAVSALLAVVDASTVQGTRAAELARIIEYIRAMYSSEFGGRIKWDVDGLKKDVDMLTDALSNRTKEQATYNLFKEKLSADSSLSAAIGDLEAANAMTEGLKKQADWAEKNTQHLHDRAEVARQTLRMKVTLATMTAMLDFESQHKSAEVQYREGVSDAYLRLKAVEQGLHLFYDYPYPDSDPLPPLSDDDPSSFDAILSWSRRVARWLAAFTRRCNNYVLTLSIKTLVGGQWEAGKANGSWSFNLPLTTFSPGECHVRIRGVVPWAPNAGEGSWQVVLKCPTATQVCYESGKLSDVFPQDVGLCRISKVVSRTRVVTPEISGATTLFNASPIGDWNVQLRTPFDRLSVPPSWPDDIELDLYLSVLTTK